MRVHSASGHTVPLPAKSSLPDWYPRRFDLARAARGAKKLLDLKHPPERLTFTDADLTFLKTTVGDVAIDKRGMPVLDPERPGSPIKTRIGGNEQMGDDVSALVRRHPELKKKIADFDYSEWDDARAIRTEKLVGPTVKLLKQTGDDIVVTARPDDDVADAMKRRLERAGVSVSGTLSVWNDDQAKKLRIPDELDTGPRKALAIAATLAAYTSKGATVRQVRFIDDSDENLQAAMQLLPKLFPTQQLEFIDVVHTGGERYETRVVARSGEKPGSLVDADGKPFGARAIRAYRSDDATIAAK